MRILILSGLFLFLAQSLIAQAGGFGDRERKSPEERAQDITNRMTEKLSLTESQQDAIYAINLDHAQQNEGLIEQVRNGELDREDLVQARVDAEKNRDEKITALLTEEQIPIWEEMKEEAKKRAQERMKNRRGKRNRNN